MRPPGRSHAPPTASASPARARRLEAGEAPRHTDLDLDFDAELDKILSVETPQGVSDDEDVPGRAASPARPVGLEGAAVDAAFLRTEELNAASAMLKSFGAEEARKKKMRRRARSRVARARARVAPGRVGAHRLLLDTQLSAAPTKFGRLSTKR